MLPFCGLMWCNIIIICILPYSGKVWRAECLANLLFSSVWRKKVWRMNISAKGLSMVTTNSDGFSLANRRRFAKFAKLSPHQTFPLYGSLFHLASQNTTEKQISQEVTKLSMDKSSSDQWW